MIRDKISARTKQEMRQGARVAKRKKKRPLLHPTDTDKVTYNGVRYASTDESVGMPAQVRRAARIADSYFHPLTIEQLVQAIDDLCYVKIAPPTQDRKSIMVYTRASTVVATLKGLHAVLTSPPPV